MVIYQVCSHVAINHTCYDKVQLSGRGLVISSPLNPYTNTCMSVFTYMPTATSNYLHYKHDIVSGIL